MDRSHFRIAFAVGLAVLGASVALAQPAPAFDTDHFLCYEAIDRNPNAPITISLEDQFGTLSNVSAMTALEFCNPTRKTVGTEFTGVAEGDLHLTFYELTQKLPSARKRVEVTNQFGTQVLRVAAPRMIAVPTLKNRAGDENDLDDINHFTCYEASGKRVLVEADVEDQFRIGTPETILVHSPHFLCNPTVKTRGTEESPVPDENDHLVCYKVTPSENPAVSSVEVENQFEGFEPTFETFDIGPLHYLCAPSTKTEL